MTVFIDMDQPTEHAVDVAEALAGTMREQGYDVDDFVVIAREGDEWDVQVEE